MGEKIQVPKSQKEYQNSVTSDKASIVIPCREVDAPTERCVAACLRIYPRTEVIVVPDTYPFDGTHLEGVVVLPSGPLNPAAKRNMAARVARGEFLAFIDSDAYPETGWLEAAIKVLEQSPTIGAVGGPTLLPPDQPWNRRVVGNAQCSVLLAGPFAFKRTVAQARDCQSLSTCNLILRRQNFLAVGGMDGSFFTSDDASINRRIKACGRVYFCPEVRVYHQSRTLQGLLLQRLAWGFDSLKCIRQFNTVTSWLSLVPTGFLIFLLSGWILLFFGAWKWVYLIPASVFMGVSIFESVRLAGALSEVIGTWVAIVGGSLAVGAGVILSVLGVRLDPRRFYRNTD